MAALWLRGHIIPMLAATVAVAALAWAFMWWRAHAPHEAYSYTACRDGWISDSTGPGTCSHHGGVNQYVYVTVTAPPGGW